MRKQSSGNLIDIGFTATNQELSDQDRLVNVRHAHFCRDELRKPGKNRFGHLYGYSSFDVVSTPHCALIELAQILHTGRKITRTLTTTVKKFTPVPRDGVRISPV